MHFCNVAIFYCLFLTRAIEGQDQIFFQYSCLLRNVSLLSLLGLLKFKVLSLYHFSIKVFYQVLFA